MPAFRISVSQIRQADRNIIFDRAPGSVGRPAYISFLSLSPCRYRRPHCFLWRCDGRYFENCRVLRLDVVILVGPLKAPLRERVSLQFEDFDFTVPYDFAFEHLTHTCRTRVGS